MNWGGQEYRTLEEVRWLRSRGHMAWIACDPRSEMMKRAGREVCIPVPMAGSMDWRATRAIQRFCQEEKVDVIHTHSSRDSWVCYPLHVAAWPVVRSRQITNLVRPSLDRSFIYRHGCAQVVASADCIRKNLIEHTGVAARRVEVIGEGIDLDRFNPGVDGRRVREEWGVGDDVVLFGLVAMIRPEKGHQLFIDAALEIVREGCVQMRFVIVGEGVGGRELENACRARLIETFGTDMDGPVFMAGFRQDMPEVMAALDVLVVPSLAEAQSIVTPQAFATERPVIASRVGGLPELIEHESTGLLVEPGNVGALKEAMMRVGRDRAQRVHMGRRALEVARCKLSFEVKMSACLALYENVVARGRRYYSKRRQADEGRDFGKVSVKPPRRSRPAFVRSVAAAMPVLFAVIAVAFFIRSVDSSAHADLARDERLPRQVESAETTVNIAEGTDDDDDGSYADESAVPSLSAVVDEQIIG